MSDAVANVGEVLREYTLGLAFSLAIMVHVLFNAASLDKPLSLYVLFVFLLLSWTLLALVDAATTTRVDVRRALSTQTYPATLRAPVSAGFTLYIGAWLLWWIVTQLFRSAGVLYDNDFMLALVAPLVLAVATTRGLWRTSGSVRAALLAALRISLLVSLFFPSRSWAPQHSSSLGSMLRVVAYFLLVYVLDYLLPAIVYVDIDRQSDVDILQRNDLETGASARHIRMDAVLEAQRSILRERDRQSEIVALSAWVLVTPLYVSLLLSVPLVGLVLIEKRPGRNVREATPSADSPPAFGQSNYYNQQPDAVPAEAHERKPELDSAASESPPAPAEPQVIFPNEVSARAPSRVQAYQARSPSPAATPQAPAPAEARRSYSQQPPGSFVPKHPHRKAGVVWRAH